MKKLIVILLLCCSFAFAGGRGGHSRHSSKSTNVSASQKTVHVRSYTTKKGKHVRAYKRRPPTLESRVRMRCVAFPDEVLSDRVRVSTKLSRDSFVEFA